MDVSREIRYAIIETVQIQYAVSRYGLTNEWTGYKKFSGRFTAENRNISRKMGRKIKTVLLV